MFSNVLRRKVTKKNKWKDLGSFYLEFATNVKIIIIYLTLCVLLKCLYTLSS